MQLCESDGYLAKGSSKSKVSWKQKAQRLQKEVFVLYFVFRNRRTPWYVRGTAACSVAYVFSPVQLIPSFLPVIGFLDDFAVLFVGAKLVRRFTHPDILRESCELADAAEARQKEDIKSGMWRFAIVLSAASWLLGAIAVSALLTAYFYH